MNTIRPDRESIGLIMGKGTGLVTVAHAANDGECPFHADCEVLEDQPIKLRGKALATDEHGHRYVDLSAAEWGCVKP